MTEKTAFNPVGDPPVWALPGRCLHLTSLMRIFDIVEYTSARQNASKLAFALAYSYICKNTIAMKIEVSYDRRQPFDAGYTFVDTPYGEAVAVFTDKGLCYLGFTRNDRACVLRHVADTFPNMRLAECERAVDPLSDDVVLHLIGTPFRGRRVACPYRCRARPNGKLFRSWRDVPDTRVPCVQLPPP